MSNIQTLTGIKGLLKTHEKELYEKHGIKQIGIFGSYLRGDATEISDVDILIEFKKDAGAGLLKFIKIENYLSDLLGIKVDLVEKASLKPNIGTRILKEVTYI